MLRPGHAPRSDPGSHWLYTNQGDTLSYLHEVDDKGVTSWFGAKGSPTVFKARWIDENGLSGAWEWPGGGYKLTLSRIKGAKSGATES